LVKENKIHKIVGALLVAPADVDSLRIPQSKPETSLHSPKLDFPTVVITSSNDPYISVERPSFYRKNGRYFYKYWRKAI
jgi:predicted alpha/beta hydrolase family esterase